MSKQFLDYDPLTKTTTWFEGNGDGSFKVCSEQDFGAILEHNKRLANDESYKRAGIKSEWYHFATVPNSVMHKIMVEHHVNPFERDDLPRIEKILNSPDYKYLRTVNKI